MTNESTPLKEIVRSKYAEIARQDKSTNQSSCCGAGGCSTEVYTIMADAYQGMEGYVPEADLGLGCGLPTEHAHIRMGDTVVDLGSGAGNDCFVVRSLVGETGQVIGIDFTPEMLQQARANASKLGFTNVEFREGDIEHIPVDANTADVVISNCVLNLVPDKARVMQEMYRILKPGAHFSVSDIVLDGTLPPAIRSAAEMYAGCVSGAIQSRVYLEFIQIAGFEGVTIQREKPIYVPDDILLQYVTPDELAAYRAQGHVLKSITVYGRKPLLDGFCDPTSGCCC